MIGHSDSDAVALAHAIRNGTLSAVDAVDAALERIVKRDTDINACAFVLTDRAKSDAQRADRARAKGHPLGPLHGVPVAIKDHIFVAGVPATMGTESMRNFVPTEDAAVVARLCSAGAIVVAKTTSSELCWSGTSATELFGPTRNPYDPRKTVGGSSGGSAAIVAADMVTLAIGSDSGGSIRVPAAFCGVVGYKPTNGLVPRTPGFETYRSTNVIGPLAKSVRDVVLTTSVIAGPDASDDLCLPGIPEAREAPGSLSGSERIAWCRGLTAYPLDPAAEAALSTVVRLIASLGLKTVEASPDLPAIDEAADLIVISELQVPLPGGLQNVDDAAVRKALATPVDGRDLFRAHAQRAVYARAWAQFFDQHDLLVMPTVPVPAFCLEHPGPPPLTGEAPDNYGWMANTFAANLYRGPAISLPVSLSDDGLPIGIQIMGPVLSDDVLLAVAAAVERLIQPLAPPNCSV